jgi:Zn-dependent protease with chaperone function
MAIFPINVWLPIGAVLLLPTVLTLWFRHAALRARESERGAIWGGYRAFSNFVLAIMVTGWWVMWDLRSRSDLVSIIDHRWPGTIETAFSEFLLFGALPTLGLGIFLFLNKTVDKAVLKLKWTIPEMLQQIGWKLVSYVVPLLMVAAGFDAILAGNFRGMAWIAGAGVVSRVGTAFLMAAEGLKFNALKSGELRNRARVMARRMGVTLGKVYVVPAGKGHLTNAYGLSNAIALTDNLGKYLTKLQLESVIAHELAHVKLKHGAKDLLFVISLFSVISLLLFSLSHEASVFRPLLQPVAMIGPLAAMYYCARRFEYSADGEAVDFTGDAETAIRALANMQRIRELGDANDGFAELFMTHPSLAHRIQAIAERGGISTNRLGEILREVGVA